MNKQQQNCQAPIRRRAFLAQGALFLAAPVVAAEPKRDQPSVRLALLTDLHYADRPPAGTRHYRDTLAKLAEAGKRFAQEGTDLVVELGDVIDTADSLEAEKGYLARVSEALRAIPGEHHYVVGNHCVSALTKPEFLAIVGQERTYYSFDKGGYHFLVLDACFRSDGTPYGRKNFEWTDANLPPAEVEWLQADLRQATQKCIVFLHQRLDVENHYGVKNAPQIREILEESGKVVAVVQGHYHRNDYRQLGRLHYVTLAAMVEGPSPENNAYAVMEAFPDGALRIHGFGKQQGYQWP